MKKVLRWFCLSACIGLVMTGCRPAASPSNGPPDQLSDQSQEQPFELSPQDWLREQPTESAPPEWPVVITNGLPGGFELDYQNDIIEKLHSRETVQLTKVVYYMPEGDQHPEEKWIEVHLVGHQSAEARSEFLALTLGGTEGYAWSLEQLGDAQVVRFHGSGIDGRTWVSGPYLICVISYNVDERDSWVDVFTELYLAQPPVPVAGTLLDWLYAKPFESAPPERPVAITSGLPEGFEIYDSDSFMTGELPSGERVEIATGSYRIPPEGGFGEILDSVVVSIHSFGNAAGRSEYLDMLVAFGDLSLEVRDWGLEEYSGGQVARYGRGERDKGRIWISGPYLIIVERGQEEHGDWVEPFTELYLAQYPAE